MNVVTHVAKSLLFKALNSRRYVYVQFFFNIKILHFATRRLRAFRIGVEINIDNSLSSVT